MLRSRRFPWLLFPPLLVLGLACEDEVAPSRDRSTIDVPPLSNPVAPDRSPVVRAPETGGFETLSGRELDPFSLPIGFHGASGPLSSSTVTLPVDETYGGTAGFAFRITQEGSGNGGWFRIRSPSSVNRMALLATHTGEGIAARAINTGRGRALWAQIPEASNPFPALVATHVGSGEAIEGIGFGSGDAIVGRSAGSGSAGRFEIDNLASAAPTLSVSTNGALSEAIFARTTGGENAGEFRIDNESNQFDALLVGTNGGINSAAVSGQSTGLGNAGDFSIANSANSADVLRVTLGSGTGNLAAFRDGNDLRAVITSAGDISADGTISGGGADLAEAFDVDGSPGEYAPGDVLAISVSRDRAVTRSTQAYSTRVIGVYATRPGVLLDSQRLEDRNGERIPVAVTGVVPTHVTADNGAITRGDILVSSNRAGYAMKGEPVVIQGREIYPSGAIVGKALEPFAGPGAGTILVMVNVK